MTANSLSSKIIPVGGIRVFVFGSILPESKKVGLFLLHGRRESVDTIAEFASKVASLTPNCLVFAIEQRNHGSREIESKANLSWRDGNANHAMDMWAIQYGTASDVSYLITVLPMFLNMTIQKWGVCGVSLGGHATLLALAHGTKPYSWSSLKFS